MIADEHQVPASAAHTGKVAKKDDLTEWMHRFQPVGIDKDLIHIRVAGFQCVDQFMGGSTIEISIEGEMYTVIAFKLENLEIHGHRLPSFLPPTGGIIRLPEHISIDGRQSRHTGKG